MKYLPILSMLMVMLFMACNHQTDEFDGPDLIDRFGEFEIKETLTASAPTVDFSASEKVHFNAQFSKRIEWVLKITGKNSGAVKLIEGFDNQLNQDNSTWDGSTSQLPLFRAEPCDVSLIIPEEDSLTVSIEINSAGTKVYNANLITDFETDPGSSIFLGNFEFDFSPRTGIQDDIVAAQGEKYYLMEGTNVVLEPNAFVGLIRIFPSIQNQTYFTVPTTIPEDLYFNFFLWEDGTPGTIAVFQFFTDTNDDGEFTDGVDKSYQIEGDIQIEDGGWRHVFPTMAQTGIPEAEVDRIVALQVLLISIAGSTTETRFGLDYLAFTKDQELQL
ncbi:MAG: hypothetical protein AAFR61_03900 [Bacteroidota bacterium]